MSAQVPYGLGLTISAPAASGCSRQACSTSSGDGGCEKCRSASQRGEIQYGRTPEKISPATMDLWLSLATSRPPSCPATAIMAAFTDSELPQVEKNAASAPTASAISSSASVSTPWRASRSSRPGAARMSLRKASAPRALSTRSSTPRPCRCPGGVKP